VGPLAMVADALLKRKRKWAKESGGRLKSF
jgi:hypothetical protein